MTEYNEKAKIFLEKRLSEYEIRIKKLKARRKIIKTLFSTVIIVSITCSGICATLASFSIPVFVVPILSTGAGLATALSTKFNLKGRKEELNKTIQKLDKIRHNIDYVVTCNGDFTEDQFKNLIKELC